MVILEVIVIQFVVDSPNCDWVVSEEILAEYQDVLSRKKFKLTDEVRKEWLDVIDLVTTLVVKMWLIL